MTDFSISYEGKLRTKCTHLGNKRVIETDAPKDNHGKGEYFFPTDLFAASFGTCLLTITGIAAEQLGVSLEGTTAVLHKEMAASPNRRIGKLKIVIKGPKIPVEMQKKIEGAALKCPVHLSLHPDIVQEILFLWEN